MKGHRSVFNQHGWHFGLGKTVTIGLFINIGDILVVEATGPGNPNVPAGMSLPIHSLGTTNAACWLLGKH